MDELPTSSRYGASCALHAPYTRAAAIDIGEIVFWKLVFPAPWVRVEDSLSSSIIERIA